MHPPVDGHDSTEYMFAYSIQPRIVIKCSKIDGKCTVVSSLPDNPKVAEFMKPHQFRELHLATNAVRLSPTQFGALLHGRPPYAVHAYTFSALPPYEVLEIRSTPIVLAETTCLDQINYAEQLTFVDGQLVISFTIHCFKLDKTDAIAFYVASVDDIFRDMVDVKSIGS